MIEQSFALNIGIFDTPVDIRYHREAIEFRATLASS